MLHFGFQQGGFDHQNTISMSVVALSEGISATEFGAEMGTGWMDGLFEKFRNEVYCRTEVKIWRQNREMAGDIDLIFSFVDARFFSLDKIFPGGCRLAIKPAGSGQIALINANTNAVLVELKRSASVEHLDTNIRSFVNFYNRLLGDEYRKPSDVNVRTILGFPDLTIMYVYNHADPNTVEKKLRDQIKITCGNDDMTIHNRKVFSVWIPHQDLIGWREKIVADRASKSQARLIKQQNQELAQKQREIDEKDALIAQLRAQAPEPKQGTKRARYK
jgi:hypothetical protein